MKKTSLLATMTFLLLSITFFNSCKKSSTPDNSNDLSAINGTWQTTVWGGPNDTARITISSSAATGTLIYLNDGAKTTNFSVNDVIYSNIKSTGNNTYSCTGTFRYNGTGNNSTVGTTNTLLTMQNNNTLYAHYSADATSGITPPDYYWYK